MDAAKPDEASVHRVLADPSRRHLLELLRAAGAPCRVKRLAEETGLHPTTVRTHLQQLVEVGLVAVERAARSTGRGRPPLQYRALPDVGQAEGYRDLASALVSAVGATDDDGRLAASAGRAWADLVAAELPPGTAEGGPEEIAAELVPALDRLGFAPAATEGGRVLLRSCPLLDLARSNPRVVCEVHRGMVQGLADHLGGLPVQAELRPFDAPEGCVIALRSAAA